MVRAPDKMVARRADTKARADFATLGDYDITTTYSVNGVPEPATVGLAAAALAALLVCRARR